jgi:hypothetical protein
MENKRKRVLGFVLFTTLALFLSGCASLISFPLRDILGVWEGSYTAGQGETGLTLEVFQEGGEVKAIFKFYNLPGKSNATEGSFYMKGAYDSATKIHTFTGYEWINKPQNYDMVTIAGTVNNGNYEGRLVDSSYTFRLVKKSQ